VLNLCGRRTESKAGEKRRGLPAASDQKKMAPCGTRLRISIAIEDWKEKQIAGRMIKKPYDLTTAIRNKDRARKRNGACWR